MKHDALWSSIEKELAEVLPSHAMNTWFDPIYPVALSNGELLLEVPNQFFFEWIESHYKQNMRKAILAVTDKKIKHKFIVSAEREELKTDEPVFSKNYAVQKTTKPNINKNYLFETFIEGANNQFAKTASETVAGDLAKQSFNPLIIYGGVGLGKTHLIHAIGNRVFSENPTANVVLATSEKFTLDFVNSLRKNKTVEFAKQYRKADVLLVDDIQFFRGKEQTQEQFFHTFNELYQAGKQIVMTADRFPGEMQAKRGGPAL